MTPKALSIATAMPIRLSPAMKPELTGSTAASASFGFLRRSTSAIAAPMKKLMELAPGMTMDSPRPDAEGINGLAALGAQRSSSTSATPRDTPHSAPIRADTGQDSPDLIRIFDKPATTRDEGAGNSSVPSTSALGTSRLNP